MDSHALKIPCNAMPFVCETDYSVTHERMFHADRIAPFHVAIYLLRGSMEIIEDGVRYELLPQRLFFLKTSSWFIFCCPHLPFLKKMIFIKSLSRLFILQSPTP